MSGKLLIVGDSLCSRYMQETRKFRTDDYLWKTPDYKYWFEYLGEKLNLDVINYSFNGSGNQQIFDNAIYALNTHDDIDFAIICWSSFNRVDLPSSHLGKDGTHINLNQKKKHVYPSKIIKKYYKSFTEDRFFSTFFMIDKFINYSIAIDDLLKSKNIKSLQALSVAPFIEDSNIELSESTVYKYYMKHKLFNKLNDELFFKFPGTEILGGGNLNELYLHNKRSSDYMLNSELLDDGYVKDAHPNAEGNKLIFDALYRFILDKY